MPNRDVPPRDTSPPPTGFTLPELEERRRWLERRVAADTAEVGRLNQAIAGMRAVMGRADRVMGTQAAIRAYIAAQTPANRAVRIDVGDLVTWAIEHGWVTQGYDRRNIMLMRLALMSRQKKGVEHREGPANYWTVPLSARVPGPALRD
jgi:hypothetical protein